MKYMAKGPDGASHELTREELMTPSVRQQLKIDDSWVVRLGDEWVPLPRFIGPKDTSVSENPFAPNARWTPASVLCLVIRVIGFYFLTQVVQGLVSFISALTSGGISFRVWIGPVLSYLCYLGIGLYLLMGARAIMRLAFRRHDRP